MKRKILNILALTVLMVGGLSYVGGSLGPEEAWAQGGATCCDDPNATCYIFGEQLIIQPDAYYSSGACE